jgi:hypothetical protein
MYHPSRVPVIINGPQLAEAQLSAKLQGEGEEVDGVSGSADLTPSVGVMHRRRGTSLNSGRQFISYKVPARLADCSFHSVMHTLIVESNERAATPQHTQL